LIGTTLRALCNVAAAVGAVEPIVTVFETLGTPAAFSPKTIHFPGGTKPGFEGTVTVYVLLLPETKSEAQVGVVPQSSMRRWSVSTVCVEEPYRMMEILERGVLPVTVRGLPFEAVVADRVMVGRVAGLPSALKRYGGLKIWASKWLVAQSPQSPPPPEKTRPSCSRTAVLWYVRGTAVRARMLHVSVAGS
jgi:hypothetical protein